MRWLVTVLDGFGLINAENAAVDTGLVGRFARWNTSTAVRGSSFAYHATSRQTGPDRFEFGVRGHGPDAARRRPTSTSI